MQQDVIFVPEAAIVSFAGVKRLFTVADGKAVEHRVQTGVTADGMIELAGADLPADATVVIEGAQRLVNGQTVQIQRGSV
jgi:hypothetical protein